LVTSQLEQGHLPNLSEQPLVLKFPRASGKRGSHLSSCRSKLIGSFLTNAGVAVGEDWIAMEANLWRSEDVREVMDLCHPDRAEGLVQSDTEVEATKGVVLSGS
jgi:hypothetical protein